MFKIRYKIWGNMGYNHVQFIGWLYGWMVKKFSSTLRIEVDPRPELREDKPRSARNYKGKYTFDRET